MGVEVWSKGRVKNVEKETLHVDRQGQREILFAGTIIWAAGVKGAALGAKLAKSTNTVLDKSGRIPVLPDLTMEGHPEIFVLGDMASVSQGEGKFVPGVAPAAIQMGQYAGKVILNRMAQTKAPAPFQYFDKGSMATIGRAAAVVEIPWPNIRFGGFIAWIAWLFVHVSFLVQFQNRVLVLFQWAENYFTRNRSALLITHPAELESENKEDFSEDGRNDSISS